MNAFGKMTIAEWAVHAANKFIIGGIRLLSSDRERDFNRYHRRVLKWRRHLTGRTFYGAATDCNLVDYIPKRIFFFGVWEPQLSNVIDSALRSGDVFIDVGANVGYYSLLASKKVGASGKVVAIEAASAIFSTLQTNLTRNAVVNARLVNMAVSDKTGVLTLYEEGEGNLGRTSSLQRPGFRPVETVKMLPLDEILSEEERRKVRLIKIDIEGGELPVLERLIETLHLYPSDMQLIVEMSNDPSGRSAKIFEKLILGGYESFAVENDYSFKSYIDRRWDARPQRIDSLPAVQMDVHFVPRKAVQA